MNQAGPVPLQNGMQIDGKWSRNRWTVRSSLGVGANGAVYSVRQSDGSRAAMKVCENAGAAAFEWDLLEQMSAVCSAFPKPICIDDSTKHQGLYFYVMEQVHGRPLDDVWPALNHRDKIRVLLAIAEGLESLHRAKHAYCDIKPQNILVDIGSTPCARFVDVGGVTPFGRSVRQFTPTSDCAFFGVGERRASAHYDISAVVLMLITLETAMPKGSHEWTAERRKSWLQQAISQHFGAGWQTFLQCALAGKINSAGELVRQLYALQSTPLKKLKPSFRHASPKRKGQRTASPAAKPNHAQTRAKQHGAVHIKQVKPRRSKMDGTERFMWLSLASAAISTASAWAMYLH